MTLCSKKKAREDRGGRSRRGQKVNKEDDIEEKEEEKEKEEEEKEK